VTLQIHNHYLDRIRSKRPRVDGTGEPGWKRGRLLLLRDFCPGR